MSEPTYYEILGIAWDADNAAVTRAFRARSLATHPDKNPDDPEASRRFMEVVKAYQTLSDVHRRAAYDARVSPGKTITSKFGITLADALELDHLSIMDSPADDVLEEYVVGNTPPEDATMLTFFRDLERTEVFILYREGKAAYYEGGYLKAVSLLSLACERNPENILVRYYYGLALFEAGKRRQGCRQLQRAITIGAGRVPARSCPGVRRALHSLYRRAWRPIAAWLLARQTPELIYEDQLGAHKREQLRLKRLTMEESIRLDRVARIEARHRTGKLRPDKGGEPLLLPPPSEDG